MQQIKLDLTDAPKRGSWNKGKHNIYSKETIQKMSESHKGKHPTEKTRRKLSEAHLGEKNHMYGKHLTEEPRRKLSESHKGKHLTEEHRKKLSESHKGKHFSEGHKKNMSIAQTGRIFTEASMKKMSEAQKGEKNHSWLGGISFEPYGIEFNDQVKKTIRDRDNHICQICFTSENGRSFNVHHIDYDKQHMEPNNLITLCDSCHSKTNGDREIWEAVFVDYQFCRNLLYITPVVQIPVIPV